MTREEEIKQAVENNLDVSAYTPQDGKMLKEVFYIGAEWADENPKSPWISVEDNLPCNHDELILYGSTTKLVLVSDHEGCIGLLRMKKRSNGIIGVEPWWQWEIPAVIYYWMPIQELPKE